MKNFKKIASAIAALSLAACTVAPMAMTSFAATGGDNTITVNEAVVDVSHAGFEAYQVFAGTYNDGDENITITSWGDGVNVTALITALKGSDAFKVEEDNLFKDVTAENSVKSAQAVADIIGDSETFNGEMAKAFAKLVVANKTAVTTGTWNAGDKKITGLPDGYYVIVDSEAATKGEYEAFTLGMLQVAGGTDAKVDTKIEFPSVVKKVQEDDKDTDDGYGEGFNDVADWDANTAVPFKLIATLPDNIGEYDHYYLNFKDTLDDNFGTPTGFKVTIDLESPITVNTPDYTLTDMVSTSTNDFELTIMDLIAVAEKSGKKAADLAGKTVTVEYTATLNTTGTTAVLGRDGQQNKVTLEYSNNPNNTGNGTSKPGDTGESPQDKVIVFTYSLDITKVDGVTKGALAGAKFKLKNSEGKYAKITNGWFQGWDNDGDEIETQSDGKYVIKGLDDGTYTLVETAAPEGYNTPADGFEVKIDANTSFTQNSYNSAEDVLIDLTGTIDSVPSSLTADEKKGTLSGNIENNKGAQLPSTGGIGTTLFYLGGGALVAVAGVMLITKKRMTKE